MLGACKVSEKDLSGKVSGLGFHVLVGGISIERAELDCVSVTRADTETGETSLIGEKKPPPW